MNEINHGKGAIRINPIHRWLRRQLRTSVGKATAQFDFSVGYDVRNVIGAITIKDQGMSDSCSGQAGSYFLEIQRRLQKINEGAISAKSIYAPIAYPGGGTTVPALENAIKAVGAELEAVVPSYDAFHNPLTEPLMTEESWRGPMSIADSLTRAGYVCVDVGTDINDVANAVKTYGACIMEITGENGIPPGWDSPNPSPPASNQDTWNHFVCAIGACLYNGVPSIMILNSWGLDVGVQGVQYISQAYFESGYVDDVFSFQYDGNIQVPVVPPKSLWPNLDWFFSGWAAVDKLFQS